MHLAIDKNFFYSFAESFLFVAMDGSKLLYQMIFFHLTAHFFSVRAYQLHKLGGCILGESKYTDYN